MSNDEIFAAAYREHYWAVSRYVARRLQGRADEVEEVVAEVFTVAWRRRADLPAAPLPWLYGVARNCLANAVRGYGRRRRLVDRLGNDEAAHGRHIAAGPGTEAPGAWVHEALDRLSPGDQEILRLAAWEELGAEEIAVALGCGRRAATMRLHRARHRLRTEIARLRPTPPPAGAPGGPVGGAVAPSPDAPTEPGPRSAAPSAGESAEPGWGSQEPSSRTSPKAGPGPSAPTAASLTVRASGAGPRPAGPARTGAPAADGGADRVRRSAEADRSEAGPSSDGPRRPASPPVPTAHACLRKDHRHA